MIFTYKWLNDNGIDSYSDECLVVDEGSGRWYEYYSIIFPFEGKHYHVNYQVGLTEYQELVGEERYQDMSNGEVDCPEVEVYTETTVVKKWRPLKD